MTFRKRSSNWVRQSSAMSKLTSELSSIDSTLMICISRICSFVKRSRAIYDFVRCSPIISCARATPIALVIIYGSISTVFVGNAMLSTRPPLQKPDECPGKGARRQSVLFPVGSRSHESSSSEGLTFLCFIRSSSRRGIWRRERPAGPLMLIPTDNTAASTLLGRHLSG